MININKIKVSDLDLVEKVFQVRKTVFVEEQGVPPTEEFDSYENISNHFLLRINNDAIGAARWRFIEDKIKFERFAILTPYRNMGFGNLLLSAVLEDVLPLKKEIYLHSQLKAVPFYERQGFKKIGEMFSECDIEHFKMVFGIEESKKNLSSK